MPKALSTDLRRRVLAAVGKGLSYREAGRLFGVSPTTIVNWRALESDRGSLQPRPAGGGARALRIEAERGRICGMLNETPDLSAAALRRALAAQGLSFSDDAVRKFLKRHGLRRTRNG